MTDLAERLGRAMSEANKQSVLTNQRELSLRELGEVAARELPDLYEALEDLPDAFAEAANLPCTCASDELGCPHCNAWGKVINRLERVLAKTRGEQVSA